MKRYTDEQLSRILSASACGVLGASQGGRDGTVCIEMAAFSTNATNEEDDARLSEDRYELWDNRNWGPDEKNFVNQDSPDSVLEFLENKGLA